jgi:anti-sigma regulatory factor (Ser/Thr protein kinase)
MTESAGCTVLTADEGRPVNCFRRELPGELSAVGVARRWVDGYCVSSLSEDKRQVLELLTSEVVANAVLHGRGVVTLALGCGPGEVVVAVSDTSPQPPTVKAVDLDATGGRGVALVDALSQGWGWAPRPPGKWVWFRITEER